MLMRANNLITNQIYRSSNIIEELLISDEEFVLLYNLNMSKNFDYTYWNYSRFDLDYWSDEERRSDLWFYRADVYRLFEVLLNLQ